MNGTEAAARFGALSDPSRLAILRMLIRQGPAGAPAGDIAAALGASPSRASFHLAALARAGLVTQRRAARSVIYAADVAGLGDLVGWLIEDCCAGHPDLRSCCR